MQPQVCEYWDLSSRMLPERTYLYHLPPLGIGSPYVESLTGYVARLAAAHSVSPGTLLSHELLPRIRVASPAIAETSTTFIYESHVLNGMGETSRKWVQLLQQLTGVGLLDKLTLLSWRQVISQQFLFRRTRAWCPSCYEEWGRSKLPFYEPLLWTIHSVSHCPLHRRALEGQCPHCDRAMHPLSARSRPGYCSRCQGWLGELGPSTVTTDDVNRAVSAAEGVGDLLSAAAQVGSPPSSDHLKHNLRLCIDEFASGSKNRFCRVTGISFDSVSYCLSVSGHIRVESLASLCAQVGISPLRLLCEYIPAGTFRRVCKRGTSVDSRRRPTWPPPRPAVRESAAKSGPALLPSLKVTKAALSRALEEATPISVRTVARQLGYRYESTVYHRFPELSRALAAKNARFKERRAEELQATFASALKESPPPTIPEIAHRLGWSVQVLRYRFPEFCAALVARLPERKLFFYEQMRSVLHCALIEEPPRSVAVVAQRVERSADYLRTIHADLCRAITARYTEYKKVQAARRRAEFREQIHRAVIQLREHGITPSRGRVLVSIPNPVMKSTFILDRQMAVETRR